MPRKKSVVKSKLVKHTDILSLTASQLGLNKHYTSFFLGIAVIFLLFVISLYFKTSGIYFNNTEKLVPQVSVKTGVNQAKSLNPVQVRDQKRLYTVVPGDNLWSISLKMYKSGYSWTSISKENNLKNPGIIHVGMRLTIPKIVVANPTNNILTANMDQAQKPIISDSTYVVDRGDNLWTIAVRSYNNGYRWVDIARENNITNPNLIFKGNEIKIPK